MSRKAIFASFGLAVMLLAAPAQGGIQKPHPVFAWNGNEYLFEVEPAGDIIYLTGYRAIGTKWQRVGTTSIHRGQRAPQHGFLQRIWFHGQKIGTVVADMDNPWWRHYPADDRNGGGRIDPF